jgi:hypothetical protein
MQIRFQPEAEAELAEASSVLSSNQQRSDRASERLGITSRSVMKSVPMRGSAGSIVRIMT